MTTRWKCDECECVNDRRPAFRFDDSSPRKLTEEDGRKIMLVVAKCTVKSCGHASSLHRFTLEKKEEGVS